MLGTNKEIIEETQPTATVGEASIVDKNTEETEVNGEVNFAKKMLQDAMAEQLESLKAEAKREIEAKREKKAEEKRQRQAELEKKSITKRFRNAKRVRCEETRRLELEKKELRQVKRMERRANQEKKKQEKTCNRVHVHRVGVAA